MPAPAPPASASAGLTVPTGPITTSLRKQIEAAVAAQVPEGKTVAIIGVTDLATGDTTFGAALRLGSHWHLAAETKMRWSSREVSGQVQIAATF